MSEELKEIPTIAEFVLLAYINAGTREVAIFGRGPCVGWARPSDLVEEGFPLPRTESAKQYILFNLPLLAYRIKGTNRLVFGVETQTVVADTYERDFGTFTEKVVSIEEIREKQDAMMRFIAMAPEGGQVS